MGIWCADQPMESDPTTWAYHLGDEPGVLKLSEHLRPHLLFQGTLAHELGHAATRWVDRQPRGEVDDERLALDAARAGD